MFSSTSNSKQRSSLISMNLNESENKTDCRIQQLRPKNVNLYQHYSSLLRLWTIRSALGAPTKEANNHCEETHFVL